MYQPVELNVPEKYHEQIKEAVSKDKAFSIRINIQQEGKDIILLTKGQIGKIQVARAMGKKNMSLRMSRRQVQKNLSHEGGFLGMLAAFIASLITAAATGAVSGAVDKAVSGKGIDGDGLYLWKHGHGAKIQFVKGNGLYFTPHDGPAEGNGLCLKHEGKVYRGKGLIFGPKSPYKNTFLESIVN